jgi:hypothetical protein
VWFVGLLAWPSAAGDHPCSRLGWRGGRSVAFLAWLPMVGYLLRSCPSDYPCVVVCHVGREAAGSAVAWTSRVTGLAAGVGRARTVACG